MSDHEECIGRATAIMRDFKKSEEVKKEMPRSSLDPFADFDEIDVEDAFNFGENITRYDAKVDDNIMCCC